ncbi:MAG: ABC transporter permease [Vulcanimicrobiaceae bacterium]
MATVALAAVGLILFFGLWSLLAALALIPPHFLPAPLRVANELETLWRQPFAGSVLGGHVLASLQKFGVGFALAVVIGIPLGLILGLSRIADKVISPLFDAIRFIPPIAWVPFTVLWFGTSPIAPTLIVFAGAFAPCVLNSYRGAKFVDTTLLEAARTLGASAFTVVAEVVVPASLPSIVAGLRVSAGFAWQSLIGAELIVGSTGLGFMIVQGETNMTTTVVIAGMAMIGLLGACIDFCLRGLELHISRNWGR